MAITITYTEIANSMMGLMKVTDPDNSNINTEINIPKFMYDLIKSSVDAGTLDLQALWVRALNVSKSLPTT